MRNKYWDGKSITEYWMEHAIFNWKYQEQKTGLLVCFELEYLIAVLTWEIYIYTETVVCNLNFVLKENISKLLHNVFLIYE